MGHPEYHVNVNLSVVQLLQNDIVKKVAKVLEETRIIPQNLTLEVTESLAINDMVRMKKILSEIRNLGVRVALDDFGTGYSSLNHIREMPLDVIKIDRCFIEHLGEDDFPMHLCGWFRNWQMPSMYAYAWKVWRLSAREIL